MMHARTKWKWLAFLTLLVALAALGVGLAPSLRGHSAGDARPAPGESAPVVVPVTVAAVTPRPVERVVEVVGTLEGYEEVNVGAKVEGRVARLHHDVGDLVTPGQPLVDIDDTDYRLAVLEARRALELELARLGLKELPKDDRIDFQRVPAVVRARNLEENARLVMERTRRLGVGRAVGAEEWERSQAEARIARAGREHAEVEARAVLATARLRQAQLETAQQRLADACVRVPCPSPRRLPPGCAEAQTLRYVVASRQTAEGEMVRAFPAVTLFRLVIDHPLKLVATVPERFLGEVRVGQPVTLTVEAYPNETFAGTVTRVNPTVDRASRTFSLEATVRNPQRRLHAGSFTRARIVTQRSDQALTVPEEAIVRFAGVVKVFLVEHGLARAVPVRPGQVVPVTTSGRLQRWVEVTGVLPADARVVTSGHSQLADRTAVRVR